MFGRLVTHFLERRKLRTSRHVLHRYPLQDTPRPTSLTGPRIVEYLIDQIKPSYYGTRGLRGTPEERNHRARPSRPGGSRRRGACTSSKTDASTVTGETGATPPTPPSAKGNRREIEIARVPGAAEHTVELWRDVGEHDGHQTTDCYRPSGRTTNP